MSHFAGQAPLVAGDGTDRTGSRSESPRIAPDILENRPKNPLRSLISGAIQSVPKKQIPILEVLILLIPIQLQAFWMWLTKLKSCPGKASSSMFGKVC